MKAFAWTDHKNIQVNVTSDSTDGPGILEDKCNSFSYSIKTDLFQITMTGHYFNDYHKKAKKVSVPLYLQFSIEKFWISIFRHVVPRPWWSPVSSHDGVAF